MSFFTPNNIVGRAPPNILEQVQPDGEFTRLPPRSAQVYTALRPNEIWVGKTVIVEA